MGEDKTIVYIEDIDYIYNSRSVLIKNCIYIWLVMIVFIAIIAYIISKTLTKPLVKIQKEMEKQLETLREERIRQYEAYAEGMTDQECYLKVKKELNQKIDKIQEKYERLLTITTEDGELMKEIQVVKQEAEQAEVFDKMTRHIAETFIDEVIIYDAEKIEIRFLFDDLIAEMTEKIEREEKEDVAI